MKKSLKVLIATGLLYSSSAFAFDWDSAIKTFTNKLTAAATGKNPEYALKETQVFGPATFIVGESNVAKTFSGDKESKFKLLLRSNDVVEVVFNINGKNFRLSLNGKQKTHEQTIQLQLSNSFTLTSVTGKSGAAVTISVSSTDIILPPDPVSIAPALDPTSNYDVASSTAFIYTGPNPIQTGVAAGTIKPVEVSIIKGKVIDSQSNPLFGVVVKSFGHPEYGQTLTRANGEFDFAVNGGFETTLTFEKVGYLSAQRHITAGQRDFANLPSEVALIQTDIKVSRISVGTKSAPQTAVSSVVSDSSGTRKTAVFFPASTSASLKLADGSVVATNSLSVRASEFTVGPNGPKQMPAELPATTAYTYAVSMTADEAIAAGATSVVFSKPVYHYVENFLGLPVGTIVPVGLLDESTGRWVASENGRVIKVLSVVGGTATVDVGFGHSATVAELQQYGITPDELKSLGGLYAAGTSLWRSPIKHFSTYDLNLSQISQSDQRNIASSTQPDNPQCNCPDEKDGSKISVLNQTLGESVSISGTPFSLVYSGDRIVDRVASNTLRIPITSSVVRYTTREFLNVSVAGRTFSYEFPPTPNQTFEFQWDRMDAYGRKVNGPTKVAVTLEYEKSSSYSNPVPSEFAFAVPSYQSLPIPIPTRTLSSNHIGYFTTIGTLDSRSQTLAGWTLNVHHAYDFLSRTVYLGNGGRQGGNQIGASISVFAGNGTNGAGANETLATQTPFRLPFSTVAMSDGSVVISDQNVIRRVDSAGIVHAFSGYYAADPYGTTTLGFAGFQFITSMARDQDQNIYVADSGTQRIRKISGDSVFTLAGGGYLPATTTPVDATQLSLYGVQNIAVADDGTVFYHGKAQNGFVRIGSDGRAAVIPGTENLARQDVHISKFVCTHDGSTLYATVDGIPYEIPMDESYRGYLAAPASDEFIGIGIDRSDIVYLVSTSGRLYRVEAGQPVLINLSEDLDQGFSLTFLADDSILVSEANVRHQVRKIVRGYPTYAGTEVSTPSLDGSEIYNFDSKGKHLRTRDSLTGAVIYSFQYASSGDLISVTDRSGNVTRILRDSTGMPVGIASPDNVVTSLESNSSGYLTKVTSPLGASHSFTYAGNTGNLQSFTRPSGGTSWFGYDAYTRLISDTDATQASQGLDRQDYSNRNYVVNYKAASGVKTINQVIAAVDGTTTQYRFTPGVGLYTNITYPDQSVGETDETGTVREIVISPDPRFGFQNAFSSSVRTRTPSGLQSDVKTTRAIEYLTAPSGQKSFVLTELTNFNNKIATSRYDSESRTRTETSPLGRVSTATFDATSRLINKKSRGLEAIAYNYDSRGRVTSATQGVRATSFGYDSLGYLNRFTDPLSRTSLFVRDSEGKLLRQSFPDGREVSFDYDVNGNLIGVTPPSRPRYAFDFDGLDQVQSFKAPGSSLSTRYQYTPSRKLASITRPDGITATYGYNAGTDLLEGIVSTVQSTSFEYSGAHLSAVTNYTAQGTERVEMTYDGFLPKSTAWSGELVGRVDWTYDNNYRPKILTPIITLPNGSTWGGRDISYHYDDDGLFTGNASITLDRDAVTGLVSKAHFEGTDPEDDGIQMTDSFGYNSFGELTNYVVNRASDSAELYKLSLTRDTGGRITSRSRAKLGVTTNYLFGYDINGRLTSANRNGSVTLYSYDLNGNRLTQSSGATTIVSTYNNQDQLLTSGAFNYSYNANGERFEKANSLTGETTRYRYDTFGNLVGVSLPDGRQIEYVLDGMHRRVLKKINGVKIEGYIYLDGLRVAARYGYAPGIRGQFYAYPSKSNVPEVIIDSDTDNAFRVITDERGTPQTIIDADDGTVVANLEVDEFGKVLSDTAPRFFPFKFAGCLYDVDTKLCHFGAREYDPETGRWLQRDPIGFRGGDTNLYGYAINDPVNFVDPDGLNAKDIEIINQVFNNYVNTANRVPGRNPVSSVANNMASTAAWVANQAFGTKVNEFKGCAAQADDVYYQLTELQNAGVISKDFNFSRIQTTTGGWFEHNYVWAASNADNVLIDVDPWAGKMTPEPFR